MSIRTASHVLVALALLPGALAAATITVWEHENFGGASRVIESSVSQLDSAGWNDRISSLRIDSGQWEVCRDNDFRNCRTFSGGEVAKLASTGWNDTISSLRPVGSGAAARDPQDVAQALYRALLGRDADPDGLRNAAAQIEAGKVTDLVRGIAQSSEYRSTTQQRSASEILDQIYVGLLGRRADTSARTAYLNRIEDGDVVDVVLDLLSTDEFASSQGGGTVAPAAGGTGQEVQVQARGTGVVIWGAKGQYGSVSAAKVAAGRDGRIHISFTGSSPQSLDGIWERDGNGNLRITSIDLPTKPAIPVNGGVQLDHDQLARIDVRTGDPGSRDRVLYSFVAEDYQLPREETLCQQEIRNQLGAKGNQAVFLTPDRSRVTSNRQELSGEVLILSDNTSSRYRCEVDARGGQVLNASVGR
jgi:hypothetical protein